MDVKEYRATMVIILGGVTVPLGTKFIIDHNDGMMVMGRLELPDGVTGHFTMTFSEFYRLASTRALDWIRPEVVCEVNYLSFTSSDLMTAEA